MKYFIHDGKEQKGPFTLEELNEFNHENLFVWHEGKEGWEPLNTILPATLSQSKIEQPSQTLLSYKKLTTNKRKSFFYIISAVVLAGLSIFILVIYKKSSNELRIVKQELRSLKVTSNYFYPLVLRNVSFDDNETHTEYEKIIPNHRKSNIRARVFVAQLGSEREETIKLGVKILSSDNKLIQDQISPNKNFSSVMAIYKDGAIPKARPLTEAVPFEFYIPDLQNLPPQQYRVQFWLNHLVYGTRCLLENTFQIR